MPQSPGERGQWRRVGHRRPVGSHHAIGANSQRPAPWRRLPQVLVIVEAAEPPRVRSNAQSDSETRSPLISTDQTLRIVGSGCTQLVAPLPVWVGRGKDRARRWTMANPYWPLFDLRIRTPRVELRYPSDEDLVDLARLAAEGIHDPSTMPFSEPWTRAPSPDLERQALQFWWSRRALLSLQDWTLTFAVFEAGELVGTQDVLAHHFSVVRSVSTGSWLVQRAQGHGIGTEMRAAVLHLAFDGLGAIEAHSASFEDNGASKGVSVANGYQPNGSELIEREGAAVRMLKWVLPRAAWEQRRRNNIEIEGLAGCLPLLDASESIGEADRKQPSAGGSNVEH
jgi:RimJ/RimL family protein N-acetyltransferase